MTAAIKPKPPRRLTFKLTRKRIIALVLIVLGLFIFVEAGSLDSALVTTLTFESTSMGQAPTVGKIPVPTAAYLLVVGLLFHRQWRAESAVTCASCVGGGSVWRLLGVCGALFIPTVIIAAAAGNDTNLTTIVAESLRLATPLAIGAFAGIWCERAGVVNIAIEGMMLFAACFGFHHAILLAWDVLATGDGAIGWRSSSLCWREA